MDIIYDSVIIIIEIIIRCSHIKQDLRGFKYLLSFRTEKALELRILNIFICLINTTDFMINTTTIITRMDNLKIHLLIKTMTSKDLFSKIKLILMTNMMIITKNNMVLIYIMKTNIKINIKLIILSKSLSLKISLS